MAQWFIYSPYILRSYLSNPAYVLLSLTLNTMSQTLLNITPPLSPSPGLNDIVKLETHAPPQADDVLLPSVSPGPVRQQLVYDHAVRKNVKVPAYLGGSWRSGRYTSPLKNPSAAMRSLNGHIKSTCFTISEDDLNHSYGYALCRGDGVYTRLIPADHLPMLESISPTIRSPQGLIILPPTLQEESELCMVRRWQLLGFLR